MQHCMAHAAGKPGLQALSCEGPPADACNRTDTLDKVTRIVERYMPRGLTSVRLEPNRYPWLPNVPLHQ